MSEEKVKVKATWSGTMWTVKPEKGAAARQPIALLYDATATVDVSKGRLTVEGWAFPKSIGNTDGLSVRDLESVPGEEVGVLVAMEPRGATRLHLEQYRKSSQSGVRFAFAAIFLTRIERNARTGPRNLPHAYGKVSP